MSDNELMSDELLSDEDEVTAKAASPARYNVAVLARHPPVHDKKVHVETTVVVIGPEWAKEDFDKAAESHGVSRRWVLENKPYKMDLAVPRVIDFDVHPRKNGADGSNYNIPLSKPETLAAQAGLSTEHLARPKKLYGATYANPDHRKRFWANQMLVVAEDDQHAHTLLDARHPGKPMTLHEIPLDQPGAIPLHNLLSH